MSALTEFQISCEERLRDSLAKFGKKFEERHVVEAQSQTYLWGRVSGTDMYVFIYEDEAQFGREPLDCRYEAPDFDDGDQLINAMIGDLGTALERGPFSFNED